MLVIGAVAGLAAFKVDDNKTYAKQLMSQDVITIKNTTPFELQNLTVLYNNEKEITADVINPGESVKLKFQRMRNQFRRAPCTGTSETLIFDPDQIVIT